MRKKKPFDTAQGKGDGAGRERKSSKKINPESEETESPTSYRRIEQEQDIVIEDVPLRGGFVALPRAVLFSDKLSAGAVRCYAALLHFAWNNNYCFPGQERLAIMLGCNTRTVQRYLSELEEEGFLRVKQRGLGRTNVYFLRTLEPATLKYLERLQREAEEATASEEGETT